MTYAKGTSVSVESSQQEIAKTLRRYGVETYGFGARPGAAIVEFEAHGMPVRVGIDLPARPPQEKGRNPDTGRIVNLWTAWDQDIRECWRALLLLIKANLEAVERGIVTVEQAFLAYLVAPDGRTVGEVVHPAYRDALTTGRLQLTGGGDRG